MGRPPQEWLSRQLAQVAAQPRGVRKLELDWPVALSYACTSCSTAISSSLADPRHMALGRQGSCKARTLQDVVECKRGVHDPTADEAATGLVTPRLTVTHQLLKRHVVLHHSTQSNLALGRRNKEGRSRVKRSSAEAIKAKMPTASANFLSSQ